MVVIKWFDLPAWQQNVLLGENEYVLQAQFNDREAAWYINLLYQGNYILAGSKVVLNIDLLTGVYNNRPDGILMAIALNDDVEDIGRMDISDNVILTFTGANEII